LRVFENRVLRRVFSPKREEVTGEWRKLHNEELNEMGGACGAYGEERGVHRVLVGKPEGKRLLGSPRHRWEANIKMDLQEVGGGCGDWMAWLRIGTGGGHL
jgi:hypothetical protein